MKPLKIYRSLTLALLLFSINVVNVYSQHSLEELLIAAEENNPGLKAKRSEYKAVLETENQVSSLPDPMINLGVFVQPVETRLGPQRASLGVSQSFPWFGTLKAQSRVVQRKAEAILGEYDDRRASLFRDIRLVYNRIQYLSEIEEITEGNLGLIKTFRELARTKFESGEAGFVNLLLIDMEEKELKVKLLSTREEKQASLVRLEKLCGLSEVIDESDIDGMEKLPLPVDRVALRDSIVRDNNRLLTLAKMREATLAKSEAAGYLGKPSLTVGATYINVGPRTDASPVSNGRDALLLPQVGLRIPVFTNKYRSMQTQAKYESEALDYQISDHQNLLEAQIASLLKDYDDAERRETLYMELSELATKSSELRQTEFSTGSGDFENIIDIERKLLNYRTAYQKALYDNRNTVFKTLYLLGK